MSQDTNENVVIPKQRTAIEVPTTSGDGTRDRMLEELNMVPLPGTEFTYLKQGNHWFGLSLVTGLPQDIWLRKMAQNDTDLPDLSSQETGRLNFLIKETRDLLENKELPALVEEARAKLEEEGVFGHSITDSPTNDGGLITDVGRLAYNTAIVAMVGLWPSSNSGGLSPFLGSYGCTGNQLAGDHFRGFAVVSLSDAQGTEFVDYSVDGIKQSRFVPPTELVFIVPSEYVKEDLIDAVKGHLGVDGQKLREHQFEDRVFTLQDVVEGKVTKETLKKFRQPVTAPPQINE